MQKREFYYLDTYIFIHNGKPFSYLFATFVPTIIYMLSP